VNGMIIKVMRAVILCGCTLATDAVLAQEQEHLRNCANCKTYSSEFRDGTSETEDFSRKEVLPLLQSPPPRSSKITSEHDSSPTGNTVSSLKNVKFPSLADVVTARKDLSISGCCHVLIFYGRGDTDLSLFRSGNEALKTLTDERVATAFFGKTPFVETRNGLRFVLSGDPLSHDAFGEAHRDQCLATFGLLNLPLSTPIFLTGRDYVDRSCSYDISASSQSMDKSFSRTVLL
jgi:hypothetical protein